MIDSPVALSSAPRLRPILTLGLDLQTLLLALESDSSRFISSTPPNVTGSEDISGAFAFFSLCYVPQEGW
jgi:hypothetical protein